MKRLLLIGVGPHARNFYFPALARKPFCREMRIVAAVDLEEEQESVAGFLQSRAPYCKSYFVPGSVNGRMPQGLAARLNAIVEKDRIDGGIIATDPLSHKQYVIWAIFQHLHVLLDKPVTTRVDARLDESAARGIRDDYEEILESYRSACCEKPACLLLCVHRRYHPLINYGLDIVRMVSSQTGCPVTNIHCYHSDGQWRLPSEMVTQKHHSYFDGHGKVSHSGFHFIDLLTRIWEAGSVAGKEADSVDVASAVVTPQGLLRQMGHEDYVRHFGGAYEEACAWPDTDLDTKFVRFGEIDAEVQIRFLREGVPIGLGNLSLLHNGYSRRSWIEPGADLYKGNGRVKHEQHRVHIGPFLSLQLHSCQSKDRHDTCGTEDHELGGNNHFEMWVFRNTDMIGGEAVERITMGDIRKADAFSGGRLHIDQVKEGVLKDFADVLHGRIQPESLKSGIASHDMGVAMMSAIYCSAARDLAGNPIRVRFDWNPGRLV